MASFRLYFQPFNKGYGGNAAARTEKSVEYSACKAYCGGFNPVFVFHMSYPLCFSVSVCIVGLIMRHNALKQAFL